MWLQRPPGRGWPLPAGSHARAVAVRCRRRYALGRARTVLPAPFQRSSPSGVGAAMQGGLPSGPSRRNDSWQRKAFIPRWRR
jgi:hypothetical protein